MVNQYHSDTRSTNATMLMFNQRDGDVLVFTKKLWGMECIRMTAVANARIAAAHLLHCRIFCIAAHVLLPRLGWQLPAPQLQELAMLNAVFTFTKAIYLQDRSPRILDWTYHYQVASFVQWLRLSWGGIESGCSSCLYLPFFWAVNQERRKKPGQMQTFRSQKWVWAKGGYWFAICHVPSPSNLFLPTNITEAACFPCERTMYITHSEMSYLALL